MAFIAPINILPCNLKDKIDAKLTNSCPRSLDKYLSLVADFSIGSLICKDAFVNIKILI